LVWWIEADLLLSYALGLSHGLCAGLCREGRFRGGTLALAPNDKLLKGILILLFVLDAGESDFDLD